jgi:uncharacterized membrane protein
MDETLVVTTFSQDSRAYDAVARRGQLAAEERILLHDGAIGLLIGVLAGRLGLLLGGAMGPLVGAIADAERDDDTDSVREHSSRAVGNRDRAVLADISESNPAAADAAMAALDGRITRYARKDVEAEIAGGAEEAAHTARKELRREATAAKVKAKDTEIRNRLPHLVHH